MLLLLYFTINRNPCSLTAQTTKIYITLKTLDLNPLQKHMYLQKSIETRNYKVKIKCRKFQVFVLSWIRKNLIHNLCKCHLPTLCMHYVHFMLYKTFRMKGAWRRKNINNLKLKENSKNILSLFYYAQYTIFGLI